MSTTTQDHISNALDHVRDDSAALGEVHTALHALERAFDVVERVKVGHIELEEEIAAVTRMTDIVRERIETRIYSEAERAANLLARVYAETLRAGKRSEWNAVQWITGNSFMPPLRSLPEAERVWQEGTDESWVCFSERLFNAFEEAGFHVASPEYDNALYAVDLHVWEPVPEEELSGEETELAEEWRRRMSPDCTGSVHGHTLTHTGPCPVHDTFHTELEDIDG